MTVEIVAIDGLKLSEEAYEVLLPTPDGQIAVFDNHAQLVTNIDAGVIYVRKRPSDTEANLITFATSGGVAEISDHRVRVLADSADTSDEVVEAEAQEALKRAQRQAATAESRQDVEQAMREVALQQSKLKIAGLRRRNR